eukprot:TRINITY_DN4267_c0_g1_i1.p1 TRINITY_DN4267_c0_g1~~TRINITY_DN4267_c0_g1_i1.p1  ORF type:complete len:588 (+),score=186.25 TRINITY_DN4267_c0_g1_i1:53-1816(+)
MESKNDPSASYYPIAVLIDELKDEDVENRLNSIRSLTTIANALGESRTREELLPFLFESLDDENEVLEALATQLSKLVKYVGGTDYYYLVLPHLEHLCMAEETSVRSAAVESLSMIIKAISPNQCLSYVYPVIRTLFNCEWFTAKCSASALFASLYPKVPEQTQQNLRLSYKKLCHDDTAIVRRESCRNMKDFIGQMDEHHIISDIIPSAQDLAQRDTQDSVRLLMIENCLAIAAKLNTDDNKQFIWPLVQGLSDDPSWRVRWSVVDALVRLSQILPRTAEYTKEFIAMMLRFLGDNEPEVKIAACLHLEEFFNSIEVKTVQDCLKDYVGVLNLLVDDDNESVRGALSSKVMKLAPIWGHDATVNHLLPIFLALLRDNHAQVRLNILADLEHISQFVGTEVLSQSLLPALVNLGEDTQWRVRLGVIEHNAGLAKILGENFFNDNIMHLCLKYLGDPVASIRETAAANLKNLAELFGDEWVVSQICPHLVTLSKQDNYLQRHVVIIAIENLAHVTSQGVLQFHLLPTLTTLCSDRVPNIRMNAARTLNKLKDVVQADIKKSVVLTELEKLSLDKDRDVRYQAKLGMDE